MLYISSVLRPLLSTHFCEVLHSSHSFQFLLYETLSTANSIFNITVQALLSSFVEKRFFIWWTDNGNCLYYVYIRVFESSCWFLAVSLLSVGGLSFTHPRSTIYIHRWNLVRYNSHIMSSTTAMDFFKINQPSITNTEMVVGAYIC